MAAKYYPLWKNHMETEQEQKPRPTLQDIRPNWLPGHAKPTATWLSGRQRKRPGKAGPNVHARAQNPGTRAAQGDRGPPPEDRQKKAQAQEQPRPARTGRSQTPTGPTAAQTPPKSGKGKPKNPPKSKENSTAKEKKRNHPRRSDARESEAGKKAKKRGKRETQQRRNNHKETEKEKGNEQRLAKKPSSVYLCQFALMRSTPARNLSGSSTLRSTA